MATGRRTFEEEVNRAGEYVEAKFDTLGQAIKDMIAAGLSYDLKVFKDGVEIESIPSTIAGALTAVSLLPPARILTIVGLSAATLAGYSFRLHKRSGS